MKNILNKIAGVLKIIFNPIVRSIIEVIFFIGLIGVIYLGTANKVPFLSKAQMMIILSGSMEPAIKTGSLILIKQPSEIKKGDIITFITPRTKKIVTHRILNIKQNDVKKEITNISTKGDANKSPDAWILEKKHVIGKMVFSIPYLGYIVNFAKTPKGFFFLAVIPALIIVLEELFKIKKIIQLQYENRILTLEAELAKKKHGKNKK